MPARATERLVPRSVRRLLVAVYCRGADLAALLTNRRDSLTPPKSLLHLSTDPRSNFRETGRTFVQFLVAHCGLRPEHCVLDVGCGVGRVAVALTEYLDGSGSYEGFDIVPRQIEWCATHVTPRFPRFRFRLADIGNRTYNPDGRMPAAGYRFPHDAASFDVVIVASVFTHMLWPDMHRYLTEIARVLKPGGRCFMSFYLLNAESRAHIADRRGAFDFTGKIGTACVQDCLHPETAVAYDEDHVRALFTECGLAIEKVFHGAWSRTRTQSQDIVIAARNR